MLQAWDNKGVALYETGWRKEAVKCLEKALGIDPRNSNSWFNKGVVLDSMLGRRTEAIACYNKALEYDPHCVKSIAEKGISYDGLKRKSEALQSFRKFARTCAGASPVRKNGGGRPAADL